MNIILAKDFNLRSELENSIRNKVGLTPALKPDYLIQGTKNELNKLFLSDKSVFWGICVEVVNDKGKRVIENKEINKMIRGEIKKSGINIKN